MDNIRKKAEELMKRGDAVIEKNKRLRAIMQRAVVLSLTASAVLVTGIVTQVMKPPKKPAPSGSGIIIEASTDAPLVTAAATAETSRPTVTVTDTTAAGKSPSTSAETSEATSVRTTTAFRQVDTSTLKTGLTTTVPSTSERPQETTVTTSQGGITMKKITAFVTILAMSGALPNMYASAGTVPNEHNIKFSQSELCIFKEYERTGPIDKNGDGIIDEISVDPDINGDGTFDICDVFELRLYGERFEYCFKKYGHDQSKYDELAAFYSEEAADRILRCYNAEGSFRFMPVSAGGTDPDRSYGAQMLARYYLYKNGDYPTENEIYSALTDRVFISSVSTSDIEGFVQYIGELRENIEYINAYEEDETYTDEQLAAFARFDSDKSAADINEDGILDFFDAYDVLVYTVMRDKTGQSAENNDYFSEYKWHQTEANGDVSLDGIVDMNDYDLLAAYYKRNTARPVAIEELAEHLKKCMMEKEGSGTVPAALNLNGADVLEGITIINGDANLDGKVSLSDSVAVLQHIANRDKYGLRPQGLINADVDGVEGVTANDALTLQKWDADK